MARLTQAQYNLLANLIQYGLEKITQDATVALTKVAPLPEKPTPEPKK